MKVRGSRGIERIHGLFKAGCPVERFTEGVCGLELQTVREAFLQARLERVVRGRCDRVLGKDIAEDWNAVRRTTAHPSSASQLGEE